MRTTNNKKGKKTTEASALVSLLLATALEGVNLLLVMFQHGAEIVVRNEIKRSVN